MKHNEAKIHGRSTKLNNLKEYLAEFVYGGIDGTVTTFAVVAAAAGANLGSQVVIILGFANLIADGFAMSVGSYLSTKTEKDNYKKHESIEYWEVDNLPEKEREEIREIYEQYGFKEPLLSQIVEHITADKDRWVEVMMKEELEMQRETKTPFGMGSATFVAFVILGFVPLLVYVLDYVTEYDADKINLFAISGTLAALVFIMIGYIKSNVTGSSKIRGVLETLLLGGSAATLSYFLGDWLEQIFR